jgi:hypothetical protein
MADNKTKSGGIKFNPKPIWVFTNFQNFDSHSYFFTIGTPFQPIFYSFPIVSTASKRLTNVGKRTILAIQAYFRAVSESGLNSLRKCSKNFNMVIPTFLWGCTHVSTWLHTVFLRFLKKKGFDRILSFYFVLNIVALWDLLLFNKRNI